MKGMDIIMKTVKVNNYKMEKIADKMAKKFGKIKRGEENEYTFELFTMESNLMKIHRVHPNFKSRRVIDAINIFLLKIDAYLSDGIEYDFSKLIDDGTEAYLEALQLSCDPLYNGELQDITKENYDLDNKEDLNELFTIPVKCLLRIKKSVELWIKKGGINGYFNFLETQIGEKVQGDEQNFTTRIAPEYAEELEFVNEEINEVDNMENNYLQEIKKEFPEIRPYAALEDFKWESDASRYLGNKEYQKAETLYKKLCLAQPEHHSGFEGLADVYTKLGQRQKAEWFMKEAFKRARAFLKDDSIDIEIIEDMERKYEKMKNNWRL